MLDPGDVVYVDVPRDQITLTTPRWTVKTAQRKDDINWYTFEGWPNPGEEIPSTRITAHWMQA